MKKLVLIDGSGLVYRGFYAIPPFFKSPDGKQTNAVFGFSAILLSLLSVQKPDYLAVAFDKKGPTFRHKEYKEYKATRVKAPQELYDQIPLVKEVVDSFQIPLFEQEGYEADDILAAIIRKLSQRKDLMILIATGDFDLFQLIQKNVFILYPTKGFKEADVLQKADVLAKYGLEPNQIPDYKGLAGDNSDNIPGVFGIGPKGAVALLQKYITLEGIYEHLDQIDSVARQKLSAGQAQAFLSKKLTVLDSAAPVDFDLNACRVDKFNAAKVHDIFSKLGFKSLHKRLDKLYPDDTTQAPLF